MLEPDTSHKKKTPNRRRKSTTENAEPRTPNKKGTCMNLFYVIFMYLPLNLSSVDSSVLLLLCIFFLFSAKSGKPVELHYPAYKFEDVGGNEATLTVCVFNLAMLFQSYVIEL